MLKTKKVISVLLCIVLFFATIFAAFGASIKNTLYNVSFYKQNIISDEYIRNLKEYISDIIYHQVLLYEIDPNIISDKISTEDLEELSNVNIPMVVSSIIHGTEFTPKKYENNDIRSYIEEALNTFAQEHNLEVEEGVIDEIYSALCNTVTLNTAVFSQSYLKHLPKINNYLKVFDYWYIGIIIAALCILSIILLNIKKINTALYSLSTAVWLGSAVVFIPSVMFAVYNLPKRISMAQSPMKMFIDATIYGAQEAILWVFGSFFVLACIGLAISIFLSVKKRRKNDVSDNKKETA